MRLNPRVLEITLDNNLFENILGGKATANVEASQHWKSILYEDGRKKQYDLVRFRNGYSKSSRWMLNSKVLEKEKASMKFF